MRPTAALAVTVILCSGMAGCFGGKQSQREAPASAPAQPAAEQPTVATAPAEAPADKPTDAQANPPADKAAEATPATTTKTEQPAAAPATPASINRICPVTGDAVDTAIAPVIVEMMLTTPSEIIAIGVATEAAAEAVRRDPARYAAAAKSNRQARSTLHTGR